MSSLERQAAREILSDVRQQMEALFGHGQSSSSLDEARLAELVHQHRPLAPRSSQRKPAPAP